MRYFKLLKKALKYSISAHSSQVMNTILAIFSLMINNVIFFVGVYLLAFQGKNDESLYFSYYLNLTTMVLISSGAINTFFPGLSRLGTAIEYNELDNYLCYPIHPLVMMSISRVNIAFIGDILQGFVMLGIVSYSSGIIIGIKILIVALISFFAFVSVYILSGSVSFYLTRGATFGQFINELTLTFSIFPIKDITTGTTSFMKYITPAFLTAIAPMYLIEQFSVVNFIFILFITLISLFFSLFIFKYGKRRYSSGSFFDLKL